MQFLVGELRVNRRIVAFPDDRGLISPAGKMTVDAVIGNVKGRARKPADLARVIVPVTYRIPGCEPIYKNVSLFGPERIRVRH